MDSNADRIEQLRKRFHAPKVGGRKSDLGQERVKYSMWLTQAIIERIDLGHRQIHAKLFPQKITKGAYMEAVFEIGMHHEEEVEALLRRKYEQME